MGMKNAVLGSYSFNAKRMGGAPTITASLFYPSCLDKEWTGKEWVELNGTRYYAFRKPTSSKSHDSHMYKHEVVFTDERVILESTYFFDVYVDKDKAASDNEYRNRYRSNYTSFNFVGDIREFVYRLNDSLLHSGLQRIESYDLEKHEYVRSGYYIVIDEGIETDFIQVSFDNAYLTEALQRIHEDYNLNYYWTGKVCHVGNAPSDGIIGTPFEYRKGLMSVNISDTNNRILDRITGIGSPDNIPYYYPNDNEEGSAEYETRNVGDNLENIDVAKIMRYNTPGLYLDWFTLCRYKGFDGNVPVSVGTSRFMQNHIVKNSQYRIEGTAVIGHVWMPSGTVIDFEKLRLKIGAKTMHVQLNRPKGVAKGKYNDMEKEFAGESVGIDYRFEYGKTIKSRETTIWQEVDDIISDIKESYEIRVINEREGYSSLAPKSFQCYEDGWYRVEVMSILEFTFKANNRIDFEDSGIEYEGSYVWTLDLQCTQDASGGFTCLVDKKEGYFFEYGDGKRVPYEDSGISFVSIANAGYKLFESVVKQWEAPGTDYLTVELTERTSGDDGASKVHVTGKRYTTPSQYLMPCVFVDSEGTKRFYEAKNGDYVETLPNGVRVDYAELYKDDTGRRLVFPNIYKEGTPHEGKQDFPDIKPTIVGVKNSEGELFGEIADVAFDVNDNDLFRSEDSNKYTHSYFYIKLHKFDGADNFNLFQQALAKEEAYIEMTSGDCSACRFQINVVEIQQGSNVFYNPVKTDAYGVLQKVDTEDETKDDYLGDYIIRTFNGAESFTKRQQNTADNEVWICVKKDVETFGVLLPSANNNYRPKAGDRFVITGIKLPTSIIRSAERRLSRKLLWYMSENNEAATNIAVTFSRTYLRSHEGDVNSFVKRLNENAVMSVIYDGKHYDNLFVSNYSYKSDGNILDEVTVELVRTLSVSTALSVIQPSAGTVTSTNAEGTGTSVSMDAIYDALKDRFLSSKESDRAEGHIMFGAGISVYGGADMNGDATIGGSLTVGNYMQSVNGGAQSGAQLLPNGDLYVRNIVVGNSMVVPSVELNRAMVLLGIFIVSPASGKVKSVAPTQKTDIGGRLLYQKVNSAGEPLYSDNGREVTYITDTPVETTDVTAYAISKDEGWMIVKTEDGEQPSVVVGDMLLGFWHSGSYGDSRESSDDHRGNYYLSGFSSVYFCVEEIDASYRQGVRFRYSLRPTDADFTQRGLHPSAEMTFYGFGNKTDDRRQSIYIITKDYRLQIANKSGWTFGPENIRGIEGRLDGFSMKAINAKGEEYEKSFHGEGYVHGNAYIFGNLDMFERAPYLVGQQMFYLASARSEGVKSTDAGWTEAIQVATESKPYLWQFYRQRYTKDGTEFEEVDGEPFIGGNYSKDGKDGTSITILGSVLKVFATMAAFLAAKPLLREGMYAVNDDLQTKKPILCVLDAGKDYAPQMVTTGDCYINQEDGHLYSAGDTEWTDAGEIRGTSIEAQYSADAEHWHGTFASSDVWMRTRSTEGDGEWGQPIRIVPEYAVTVQVLSKDGTFRIGKEKTITLYAKVFRGQDDITDIIAPNFFIWERTSADKAGDAAWNAKVEHQGKREITIGDEDIVRSAQFDCIVTYQNE